MKRELPTAQDNTSQVAAEMSVRQAGARGGQATRDRHGIEYFKRIGKRGGETTKSRYGHLYREFGRRGGRPIQPSLTNYQAGEGIV